MSFEAIDSVDGRASALEVSPLLCPPLALSISGFPEHPRTRRSSCAARRSPLAEETGVANAGGVVRVSNA